MHSTQKPNTEVDKTRRKIVKKSWLAPTVVILGDLAKPAFAGGSDVYMPGKSGVCERNPNIPPCNR